MCRSVLDRSGALNEVSTVGKGNAMAAITVRGGYSRPRSIDILNGLFGKKFRGNTYQHGACQIAPHLVAWFPPVGLSPTEWAKYGNADQTGFRNILSPSGDEIRMANLRPLNPCRRTLITKFSNDIHLVFARFIALKPRSYRFIGGFVYVRTEANGDRIYRRVLTQISDKSHWLNPEEVSDILRGTNRNVIEEG